MTRLLVLAFAAAVAIWGLASIPEVSDRAAPHQAFNTPMARARLYSPPMGAHASRGELADNL
jgi:hypothetical protein